MGFVLHLRIERLLEYWPLKFGLNFTNNNDLTGSKKVLSNNHNNNIFGRAAFNGNTERG